MTWSKPLSLAQWRAAGSTRNCLGRELFYLDTAPGGSELETILLIHGFPTASWDWFEIWPALAQRYRLVAADMLGFGFSAKPRGHNYTIHEQADLLEDLCTQLGLTRLHVLAHDYGDTVAQELLARDNARGEQHTWRSLSLLNGGLFPETHHARPAQKLLHGPLGALFTRLMSKKTLQRNMSDVFGPASQPDEHLIEAFWQLIRHADGQLNMHRLIRYMRDRRQHRERWVAALCEACVPVQLINGSHDPVSGAHMVARYRQIVRSSNIVELDGIGHYPQVEAPNAVVQAYLAFLEQVQASDA